MSDSIFSPSWYRVAHLKPRLRSHVQIHRHRYRGDLWYVLQDHASGRFHRFSPLAHAFIGGMDGLKNVEELWQSLNERFGDDAPTQDEIVTLLAQLHAADALLSDAAPDAAELVKRADVRERAKRLGMWRNPLAVRLPLLDPNRFLDGLLPLVGWLFTRGGLLLAALAVGAGAVQAGLHWNELTADVTDRVLALENVLLLALIFPVVKTLHELGHAAAVKKWGGEVHELGVMFLMLIPTPYVDASAATAFRSKRQRIAVGAAGMLVELLVAAVAMQVWLSVQPGALRAVAFDTMLLAGISTLLINGNPLLRYDAYYMLMDWLEMPNLAPRSNQYLGYLVQRYAFGLPSAKSPVTAHGEAPWLAAYAVASFVYRTFVMLLIALLVASQYFVIGVVLAIWALAATVLWPLAKKIGYLFTADSLTGRRGRAFAVAGAALLALVGIVAVAPAPYRTVAQGIVFTPEESWVRAGVQGVVAEVLAASGDTVAAGAPLLRLEDPVLAARAQVLEAQVREVSARYDHALATDRVAAVTLRAELALAEERHAAAVAEQQKLVVRSPGRGVLMLPRAAADFPGTFVQRGAPLAYVVDPAKTTVRVVVPQEDVDLVRQRTASVAVRLADDVSRPLAAHVVREVPAATAELPSGALGLAGGGTFAIDPEARNAETAFRASFLFDLELEAGALAQRLGGRAYVRFDHGAAPLASQWYRQLRQLLLERLDV